MTGPQPATPTQPRWVIPLVIAIWVCLLIALAFAEHPWAPWLAIGSYVGGVAIAATYDWVWPWIKKKVTR